MKTLVIVIFLASSAMSAAVHGKDKKLGAPPHCTQVTKSTDYASRFRFDYPSVYIVPGQREAYQPSMLGGGLGYCRGHFTTYLCKHRNGHMIDHVKNVVVPRDHSIYRNYGVRHHSPLHCIKPAGVHTGLTYVCDWAAPPQVQFTLGDEYVHVVRQDPAGRFAGNAVITTYQLCNHTLPHSEENSLTFPAVTAV